MALERLEEILGIRIDLSDDNAVGVLRNINAAISTVLTMQAKVDENRLRRDVIDKLPELLQIIAAEEKKMPVLRLVASSI